MMRTAGGDEESSGLKNSDDLAMSCPFLAPP